LERRAGDPITEAKQVTSSSLARALEFASSFRAEVENKKIQFSQRKGDSAFAAELCELKGPVEVFVRVRCSPDEALAAAKLYVESTGNRVSRRAPRGSAWCTPVTQGQWTACAEFDAVSGFQPSAPHSFAARPPGIEVPISILKKGGS
jgi:hypothetical protein